MKTLLWITTGAVVTVALIAAWLSFNSTKRARATLADLAAKRTQLEATISTAQVRFTDAHRDETELQTALQKVAAKKTTAAVPAKPAAAPAPGRPDLSALMESNPEIRVLFKQSFQANLGLRYLPLYRTAGFSAGQIQKFEAAMTDAEQDRLDLQAAAKAQGLAMDDPGIAKMRQQMEEKLKNAQTEALGETGYAQLQEYKRKEPVLTFVNAVASLVAATPDPLTGAQAELMLSTLANSSSSYQKGGAANVGDVDWPKALRELQPLLPATQFNSLKANSKNGEVLALMNQFYQQRAAAQK